MAEPTHNLIYGIDDKPPLLQTATLGFQHYLTMFGSTVAIPFILAPAFGIDPATDAGARDLALIIGTMFFCSGITTLLQTTIGNKLPIVQGGTFSFLGPTFAICGLGLVAGQVEAAVELAASQLADGSITQAAHDAIVSGSWKIRMQHVQGAVIAGSVFEMAFGYSGMVGKVLRFVGPVTIAPTIALIGLALFKFGAPVAGTHWGVGGLTIGLIVLFSQYLRRTARAFELFPILLAILIAWAVAFACTKLGVFPGEVVDKATGVVTPAHPAYVDLTKLDAAPWFYVPHPFQWGMPQFGLAAVIGMLAGYLASMVESIGDYYACARLSGAPIPTPQVINRGIGTEGLGCLVAGIIGSGNGTTSYSENIGAIGLTRVGSRRVVQAGALIMLVLGAVGKFGALFTTIPQPIVGGMYCAMFGMIAAVGLSNLQFIDLNSARNLFIIGFAFFMGLSLPEYFGAHPFSFDVAGWLGPLPEGVEAYAGGKKVAAMALRTTADVINTIGSSGMAVGAVIAGFFDNTIPGTDEERGLVAWAEKES